MGPPVGDHDRQAGQGVCQASRAPGRFAGRRDPGDVGDHGHAASDAHGSATTADCVPVLACSDDGLAVAAIHAGWRGLAAGVLEAAVAALRARSREGVELVAVIGPHIGSCCYEVDEPVLRPLRDRFGADLEGTLLPSVPRREGHYRVDLGRLSTIALLRAGIDKNHLGSVEDACTRCDAARFHSFRRDGKDSGRLVNWVATRRERPTSLEG